MSSQAVEQIKERLPISDIISSYIKLDRAGANFKGKCPFHNEKTPSFMVSPERGSYYCFGCGAKGDIFTFVQEFEKMDFKEALALLAERAGVKLESYAGNSSSRKDEEEKELLRKIMEEATSFYVSELKNDDKSLDYLKNRGLASETIAEWRIGSTKTGWNNLYGHLRSLGFADLDIEKAGLAKKGNNGFYDRFRSRIIFPICDPSGKVIAFTGRFKDWEKDKDKDIEEAKYLNSPDSLLFDKSRTLYGYHKAKQAIVKWKYALLVEGQMDLLMAQQAGFPNAVATSGTALTKSQLEMLSRFSKNLLIAYDADKAGVEAGRRAWTLALSLSMDVKMAHLPEGMDPADLISKDLTAFKDALKKASHIVEFYLNALIARGLSGRALGKEVEASILPYVKAVESKIDQAHFISIISSRTGIKEEVLFDTLSRIEEKPLQASTDSSAGLDKKSIVEDNYLSKKEALKKLIAGVYLIIKDEAKAYEYFPSIDNVREETLFSVEEWLAKSGQTPEQYLGELKPLMEKEELREELEDAVRNYRQAEAEGNQQKAEEYLLTCDRIRKRLADYT